MGKICKCGDDTSEIVVSKNYLIWFFGKLVFPGSFNSLLYAGGSEISYAIGHSNI